jgi:hypothetical protein
MERQDGTSFGHNSATWKKKNHTAVVKDNDESRDARVRNASSMTMMTTTQDEMNIGHMMNRSSKEEYNHRQHPYDVQKPAAITAAIRPDIFYARVIGNALPPRYVRQSWRWDSFSLYVTKSVQRIIIFDWTKRCDFYPIIIVFIFMTGQSRESNAPIYVNQ